MDITNKNTRRKRSKIWSISSCNFSEIVKDSTSYYEILNKLDYSSRGGAFRILKQRIEFEKIDDSHIRNTIKERCSVNLKNERSIEDVLIENSTYNNGQNLKKKLIKHKLIENKCSNCGLGEFWDDQFLSLQLDHINGVKNDNRIENLRILCPNCHSQTENFAGRNTSKNKKNPNDKIKIEYITLINKSKMFTKKQIKNYEKQKNIKKPNSHKIEHPAKELLEKLLWKIPTTKIAEKYGVSDKAVEKWAKQYGITKPPRGYWAKVKYDKD